MVDSVVDSVKAIINNGGTIVQPTGMDAPEVTAGFNDPSEKYSGYFNNSKKLIQD